MSKKIPITRLEKFFGAEDFALDIEMGREWLEGDLNFTLILYRVDRQNTKSDDTYGETLQDGISYLPPIEFKGYVQIEQPENKDYGNSRISQMEPGNLKVGVYQKYLDELGIDIDFGDYLDNFNEENGYINGRPCDTSRDGGDYSTRSRSSGVSFSYVDIRYDNFN